MIIIIMIIMIYNNDNDSIKAIEVTFDSHFVY